jgi:hypothetical protein
VDHAGSRIDQPVSRRSARLSVWLALVFLFAVLSACTSQLAAPSPTQRIYLTDPRAHYRFEDGAEGWTTFVAARDQALFRVRNGALEGAVTPDTGFIWSLSGTAHRDAVIRAAVRQTEGESGSAYGLMCRADSSGNGYYFLITSSGHFTIRSATPVQNNPVPLVDWQHSDAIRQGDEANELQAICVGDYLSFSVNGRFLAEVRDDSHASGELGVALGASQHTVWAQFDDIIVREAGIAG